MNYTKTAVPVSPQIVHSFITENGSRFKSCLEDIMALVGDSIKHIDIYKIYGRDEKQNGEILKDSRKIRLKFNSYYNLKRKKFGSLWETPDIIGYTIVVPYPSTISEVCISLDEIIDRGALRSVNPKNSISRNESDVTKIRSKYGRSFDEKGYFGCHYNLRTGSLREETSPICEIQIKTLLHDAWGAKTHDLTYKTSSEVDQSLVNGFELLGDSLAKIDQQSDLLRNTIQKPQITRNFKKQKIILLQTETQINRAFSKLDVPKRFQRKVLNVNTETDIKTIKEAENFCLKAFETKSKMWSSALLLFIGVKSKNRHCISNAQEAFFEWEDQLSDPLEKARAGSTAGLMKYFSGDTEEAINDFERVLDLLINTSVPKNSDRKMNYYRRLNSTLSSLSYYHAEIIGSHLGKLLKSDRRAKSLLAKGLANRRFLNGCPRTALVGTSALRKAISDPSRAHPNFSTLDCELFVRALTAETVEEINLVRQKMQDLHKNPPQQFAAEAELLFDFHDFCARARLANVEMG